MAKLVTADFLTNNELCVLYYTTNDSKKLYFKKDAFDAEIQSHTYENRGKIVFDKPISRIGKFSFCEGEYYLRDVVIPSSVTHIENNAFHRCYKLETIYLSNNILSIDKDAFNECNSLNSVQYNGGIASWCKIKFGNHLANPLYNGAKLYLNGVEAVDIQIPSDITEIQAYAFCGYSSIKSVSYDGDISGWLKIKFGNGQANPLHKGAKLYLNGVEAVDIQIPSDITEIQAYAFYGYSSIKSVSYDGDISGWLKIKFGNASSNPLHCGGKLYLNGVETTDIQMPSDITEVKAYAFIGSSLNNITFSSNIALIGEMAFANCKSLKSITIPNSVIEIGNGAFSRCTSLKSVTIPDSVTSIGDYVFNSCSCLTDVTIPDSVIKIGNGAFSDCKSLKSITIPNSVTEIGNSAFWECKDIKVNIPESVTYIGKSAFYNCTGELYINSNIIERDIGFSHPFEESWFGSAYFSKITIGENVKKIGCGAFEGSECLKEVKIPDSVTSIGDYAFEDCSSLTSITIPNSINSIGGTAFSNCRSLPVINGIRYADTFLVEVVDDSISLNIKDGTRFIGAKAFFGCRILKNITIPKSVIMIGSRAFSYIPSINVHISDLSAWCKIEFIGKEANPIHNEGAKLLLNGAELKDIAIPSDVSLIGRYAFYNCRSLTSVTISDSVTSIGESAFESCDNVETISLGRNVSEIGEKAFCPVEFNFSCLKTVICKAEIPPKLEETYKGEGCYYLETFGSFETLIVPNGCEGAYTQSDWNRFITNELERVDLLEHLECKAMMRKELENIYEESGEDYDAEYESYLALGGDPEKYRKGCLDNYMDSIGL